MMYLPSGETRKKPTSGAFPAVRTEVFSFTPLAEPASVTS
jgi:hypothetical protein